MKRNRWEVFSKRTGKVLGTFDCQLDASTYSYFKKGSDYREVKKRKAVRG